MRRTFPVAWCLVLFTLGANSPDDGTKRVETFEGNWRMVGCMVNGVKATPGAVKDLDITLMIRGKKCTITVGFVGKTGVLTIRVDPSRKPGRLDVLGYWPKDPERRVYGIYRFSGEKVEIALDSSERPTDFISREHDDKLVITLKRVQRE